MIIKILYTFVVVFGTATIFTESIPSKKIYGLIFALLMSLLVVATVTHL